MLTALAEAEAAAARGEVPVGAVIVAADGTVLATAGNRTRELADPTAHAEMLAIREACQKLGAERLGDADIYVTLEPCPMCAAAISFARLRRLYFGAAELRQPKNGRAEPRSLNGGTHKHNGGLNGGSRKTPAAVRQPAPPRSRRTPRVHGGRSAG